ncbi:LOW QUALITY PROTEIN: hypothetical protein U9M48_028825 [Paspalum notatum var. saurae]|uniref:Uncharacterized protein n=1 Tax=Paspalum notatum var. saurae TaxID=547442 RepID=A0AAQ3TX68_PASNO
MVQICLRLGSLIIDLQYILQKKSTHVDTGRCLNSSVLMPTLLMSLHCYTIRIVQKIYNHRLEPVEGMHVSQKQREEGNHKRSLKQKMSRMGTIIRCGKCKGVGHNISICDKWNAGSRMSTC